jgi:hypothetical protein
MAPSSASQITLKNSTNTGAITVTGGIIQPLNYYRQLVSGAPTQSGNGVQFVAAFAAINANFPWQEWCIATGGAATNAEAQPPPHMLNRVQAGLGTKTNASVWTLTVNTTLA